MKNSNAMKIFENVLSGRTKSIQIQKAIDKYLAYNRDLRYRVKKKTTIQFEMFFFFNGLEIF
jgi:hypothetical protein